MSSDIVAWWAALNAASASRDEAVHQAYQALENAKVISKVTVAKYLCDRDGCVLATVIRVGDDVVARTRDYKLSPGANADRTVEAARAKNTLNGSNHWPGHTFLVSHLAAFGQVATIDMNCSHRLRAVRAVDILAQCEGKRPGHPGAPTRV